MWNRHGALLEGKHAPYSVESHPMVLSPGLSALHWFGASAVGLLLS